MTVDVKKAALLLATVATTWFVFASTSVATQAGGRIIGRIKYTGQMPVNSIVRLGADPRCVRLYAGRQARTQAFTVAADGSFADVLVTLDGSFPATPCRPRLWF